MKKTFLRTSGSGFLLFCLVWLVIGAASTSWSPNDFWITVMESDDADAAKTALEITEGGDAVDYNSVTNALGLTGSTTTFLRSDGTQASAGSGFARTALPAPTDAGVSLVFAATPVYSKLVTTGNVTIAFGSLAVNRTYDLLIANSQATNITVTLPVEAGNGFTKMGFIPTTIAAGKHGQYWFTVDCQTNTIVFGTFAEQP